MGGVGCVFGRVRNSWIFWMVMVAGVVTGFYKVENWRGKRAWERFREESAKRGVVLDVAGFAALQVPSRSNVLAAPMMTEWFAAPNQWKVADRMQVRRLFMGEKDVIAEVRTGAAPETNDATAIQLRFVSGRVFLKQEHKEEDLIPLILMDDVPLPDAIRNLARQANVNYAISPQAIQNIGQAGKTPLVSLRWENVTARQALEALLANHNLELAEDPKSSVCRIGVRSMIPSGCRLDLSVREVLRGEFEARNVALLPEPTVPKLRAVSGGFVLFSDRERRAAAGPKPVSVALQSDEPVTPSILENLLQTSGLFERRWEVAVRSKGEHSLQVFGGAPAFCGASDYLERTEQFGRDFQLLGEALKRPAVRHYWSGGKTRPFINYATVAVLGDILGERAQALLLLDRPAEALEEIRLVQGVGRLLEHRPGEPFGLGAAGREVWLIGLCGSVIADGFRLGKWREEQLRELQEMLAHVDLPAAVARAYAFERAVEIHELDNFSADDYVRCFLPARPKMEWERMRSPQFWYLTLAPRGWVYQNMVKVAEWTERWGEVYDRVAGRVEAGMVAQNRAVLAGEVEGSSLFKVLAKMAVPFTEQCWEAAAEKQALVCQARVACALERYRLARGRYPEELAELRPQFLEEVPRDCMSGEEMVYHRMPEGEFLLYSVGWNQRDEGGWIGDAKRGGGDWVWPQFLEGGVAAAGG